MIISAARLSAYWAALALRSATIDVAVVVAGDDHHFHAAHLGGGRVGAVADLGIRQTLRWFAVGARGSGDRHEAGVFALGAGVGLHADGVEAGDLAQLGGEAFDHLEVAGGLIGRGEGWMSANSGR